MLHAIGPASDLPRLKAIPASWSRPSIRCEGTSFWTKKPAWSISSGVTATADSSVDEKTLRSRQPPWPRRDLGGRRERCRHRVCSLRDVPATESHDHNRRQNCNCEYGNDHERDTPSTAGLAPFDHQTHRRVFVHVGRPLHRPCRCNGPDAAVAKSTSKACDMPLWVGGVNSVGRWCRGRALAPSAPEAPLRDGLEIANRVCLGNLRRQRHHSD